MGTDRELPTCSPESSRLETDRKKRLLGRLWLHYPAQDMPPEAWQAITEDFLSQLSHCPAAVLERAIERGQRDWNFRPSIAQLLKAIGQVSRDDPPPAEDWRAKSLGGYTARRRAELTAAWLRDNAEAVARAKGNGFDWSLLRAVEDGANIVAQTEWQRERDPAWRPARRYCENVSHDPVRGWQVDPNRERIDRWLKQA